MGNMYAVFKGSNTLTMCLSPEDYRILSLLKNGMKYKVSFYTDFFFMGKPGKSDQVKLENFGDTVFPVAFFDIVEE